MTGYDLARQGDQQQFLSAPLLNYLYYQGTDPKYNIHDDLYSLGLVVIAIVLEVEPKELFFVDSCNFKKANKKKINEGLGLIKENYGGLINSKVKELLGFENKIMT